jgi:hypothetical protein
MKTIESMPSLNLQSVPYIGAAKVLSIEGDKIQLECPDCYPTAQMAMNPRYDANVGDIVVAAGSGQNWFIIGLLQGSGASHLSTKGNLILSAPEGDVEIIAAGQIDIKSKKVSVGGEEVEIVANHLLHRVQSLTQWIVDSLHQRAGRVITHIEGAFHLKAERITQRADEDVKVIARSIHLN